MCMSVLTAYKYTICSQVSEVRRGRQIPWESNLDAPEDQHGFLTTGPYLLSSPNECSYHYLGSSVLNSTNISCFYYVLSIMLPHSDLNVQRIISTCTPGGTFSSNNLGYLLIHFPRSLHTPLT